MGRLSPAPASYSLKGRIINRFKPVKQFGGSFAGRQTVERLDRELDVRSKRVLVRLDRCIDGCKPIWTQDSYRLSILRQMETDLRKLKASNVLDFAASAVSLVLLVILFFAVMMSRLPRFSLSLFA